MNYYINHCDGYNHGRITGTLDEAKAKADACIDIPKADLCIQDEAGNTLAIRRWHKTPVSEEQDPSACLDFGYYGHYGPWEDDPETVARLAREDAESIGRIMDNLRAGLNYGHYMANVRFPMYWCDLRLLPDGRYIEDNHAGSSAVRATPEQLLWLITVIFKLRPTDFERRYDAYDPKHCETRQRLNYGPDGNAA